ncbi:DUF6701 domain-containing protein [Vibrio fluminensis]|uniref:DUF6701 domain-containing protein n=1 Tax=Vibrio fluminensis TaxID=2783614 RepID=UPI0018875798|nr:DUF6701 domain-containing protein [Vibrio fluminensis]
MKNSWILFVLALLFSSSTLADSDGDVRGFVFEHYNYGGVPHEFNPAYGMSAMSRKSIKVRLTRTTSPHYVYVTSTGHDGYFDFDDIPNGTYRLDLPGRGTGSQDLDGDLYSERGDCNPCLPVRVYPSVSEKYEREVVVRGHDVDASIGFSYSVVSNHHDSGVGTLRQFLINTAHLTTGRHNTYIRKEYLRQEHHTFGVDNAIFKNQVNDIVLQSPLHVDDVSRTYIDARVLLGNGRPLNIRNGRTNPLDDEFGIEIANSDNIRVAGINWSYFVDAIYLNRSDKIEIVDNSFNHTRDSGLKLERSDDNTISRNIFNDTVNYETAPFEDAALFVYSGSNNTIENNAFYDTGTGGEIAGNAYPVASAVRIYEGFNNRISQNTFSNTSGLAIDLRMTQMIGHHSPNDQQYLWSGSISNRGIDYPILQSVSTQGTAEGSVTLNDINAHYALCDQNLDDLTVELYKADGKASNHTLEGTAFLGSCRLDNSGQIDGCRLDTSRFKEGDLITSITIDKCGNTSEMGQTVTAGGGGNYDYGDAPNQDLLTGWDEARYPVLKSDNGARHVVVADTCLLPLGANDCAFHVDTEPDGQPSRYATAEEEDDGITINPNTSGVNQSSMRVLMTGYLDPNGREQRVANQIGVRASKAGYVSIWLDKNQDGSWQGFERNRQFVSEKIVDGVAVNKGDNLINNIYLSAYDVHGESFLRVRYSTDRDAITEPTGLAPDGEVEDYQVWLAAPSLEVAGCEAGLQNGSFEHFYTERDHNSWDTPESSVAGWSVQQLDPKANPQDYTPPQARRNHIEFNRYNYYVNRASFDGTEHVAEINVYNPTMMYQDIVTKPGDKIRWSFDYSNRTVPNSRENDQISLLFGSPNSDLVVDQTIDGQDRWVNHTGVYTVPADQFVTRIAFKANKPLTSSAGNILDNAKFGCEIGYDYGDLPSRYSQELDVGYHVVPNLYIGDEAPDVERIAQSSEYAKGDDQHGFSDELTFSGPVMVTRYQDVEISDITVFNSTGKPALLKAWIDFDGNGKMDNDELATPLTIQSKPTSQLVTLSWTGSKDWASRINQTFLRIALSQSNQDSEDGEVEDHLVYIINHDLMPEPGRCDGFVQVKAPDKNGAYQYAKWVASGGELSIEPINSSLATDEIKVVGLSQSDGLTYGVGSDSQYSCAYGSRSGCEMHLFVADQRRSPAAEFIHLSAIRSARDNVVIRDRNGKYYKFNQNDVLDTKKNATDGQRRLGSANSGDVTPDGRYMVIGRGSWHTLVRIDLATGLFDTIQLDIPIGQSTPWSADFAFNLKDTDSGYVYALSRDLRALYRIAIKDVSQSEPAGSYRRLPLTLKLNSNNDVANPVWPVADSDGKLGVGGLGINKGGIMFAMTNGGIHDLDQNGERDSFEQETPTTALYSIDIAKQEIRFELKGGDRSTSSNDAGGCAIHADYGDVPEILENGNPARHLGSSEFVKLGDSWSADIGPGHDVEAASDLSDDGVTIRDSASNSAVNLAKEPLIPGRSYKIDLDKRGGGQASAWVNWGNNAQWNRLDLSRPMVVPSTPTSFASRGYIRVRYAHELVTSPYGEAGSGEVEDHSFEIGNPVKGVQVSAPSSPLTCEAAEYQVKLDVDGDQLSEDINVELNFNNPPAGCWFNASVFERGNASSQTHCNAGKTILFSKGSNLTRSIWVATDSELKDIVLTAHAIDIGSASAGARFTKEGFKITPYQAPKYYKAGEEFQIQLVRKVALADQVQCSVDPDYQGDKTFTFGFDKGTEKELGNLALKGAALKAAGEKRTISFSNGVSEVLPAKYSEAGEMILSAKYTPTEGEEKSATFEEVFTPYALVVRQNYKADDTSVISQQGSTAFVSAGAPFMVEVAGVNKTGEITQNFDAQLSAGGKGYSAAITVPESQVSAVPKLSTPNGFERTFNQGLLLNRFEYDNVGSLRTTWVVDSFRGKVGLDSFLDTSKVSDLANHDVVGYFYPDHYLMTRRYQVPMNHAGEPWTYFGKPDVDVSFMLEAKSANDSRLSFYDGSILKQAENPALASLSFDYGSGELPACNQVLLVDDDMESDVFIGHWSEGEWQLDRQPNQFYRDVVCKQELSNVVLNANVEDNISSVAIPIYEQGDTSEDFAAKDISLGEPIDVRFGRLVIENASGPIDQLMPMAIETQYWNNNRFELNDWDQSTQIGSSGEAQLPDAADIVTESAVTGEAKPVLMSGSMEINNISDGKGRVDVGANAPGHAVVPMTFSEGVEKWLGYCWEIDSDVSTAIPSQCNQPSSFWQPPKALATFGVSGGSNNVIYIKERYN